MSKKKAKSFLPKKIAGVKVPKKVRQGRFGELLASPSGQKLIAQALVAAGALAAGKTASDNPKVREAAKKAKDTLVDAEPSAKVADTGGALAYALAEAARSFTEALRTGERRSFQPLERSEPPGDDDPADERKSSAIADGPRA